MGRRTRKRKNGKKRQGISPYTFEGLVFWRFFGFGAANREDRRRGQCGRGQQRKRAAKEEGSKGRGQKLQRERAGDEASAQRKRRRQREKAAKGRG